MFLYHLTLQTPTHASYSVQGSFTGEGKQEVVIIRGSSFIQLLSLTPSTGKLHSVDIQNFFCTLRSVAAFRPPGVNQDYLVLGSDSGRLIVLIWEEGQGWKRLHKETFGRSGVRRVISGEYVVSDPRGRAVLIGAIEKQKLVYLLNRDPDNGKLTISSPLESSRPEVITFSIVALDTGYENPSFIALEVDTSAASEENITDTSSLAKVITCYELEIGFNHLAKKWSEPVRREANFLFPIPGGDDGPGGVLIFSPNHVQWYLRGHPSIESNLPVRKQTIETVPRRPALIISAAVVKARNDFFILAHTEEGDLFRISFEHTENTITSLNVNYYDSIPVSNNIHIFKSGFLLSCSEWEDLQLYQVQSLGEKSKFHISDYVPHMFSRLSLVDRFDNYANLIGAHVKESSDSTSLISLQGNSDGGSLSFMKLGLRVTEVANSELPDVVNGVWTLKKLISDVNHSFIIISFSSSTVMLQVSGPEGSVDQVADSGLVEDQRTLSVGLLENSSIIQVFPTGWRQVLPSGETIDWVASSVITCSTLNSRQLAISLETQCLIYFEIDDQGVMCEKRSLQDLPDPISSLALAPVPEGRLRARFLAVASDDMTIRILSCDPDDNLEALSLQALASKASDLLISAQKDSLLGEGASLTLNVGLENGVLVRLKLDHITGALTEPRTRYLGSSPVKLSHCSSSVISEPLLHLSSKPWLSFSNPHNQTHHLTPLCYSQLIAAAPFVSEQCPGGFVATDGSNLLILMVESVDEMFTRSSLPLNYTPRQFAVHEQTNLMALIEMQQGSFSSAERQIIEKEYGGDSSIIRNMHSFTGKWNSSLKLLKGEEVVYNHLFDENIASLSTCFIKFHDRLEDLYVAVGVSINLSLKQHSGEHKILLFKVDLRQNTLTLTHTTSIDGIPYCMAPFGGRLLVGAGCTLRLYDIGKKQLLRKCEIKLPSRPTTLDSQGWRIWVGSASSSLLLYLYHPSENQFQLIADEVQPRPITSLQILDYDTVAIADQLGSFAVLRLPASLSNDLENENMVAAVTTTKQWLYGAPYQLEKIAEFYLGDTITYLSKATLSYGARPVILYTTICGLIGVFLPLTSRKEALFLQNVELALRPEYPATIAGREHLIYRSYNAAVKSVIDGDLCEMVGRLKGDRLHYVAQTVEKTPAEIIRKLQDVRISIGI